MSYDLLNLWNIVGDYGIIVSQYNLDPQQSWISIKELLRADTGVYNIQLDEWKDPSLLLYNKLLEKNITNPQLIELVRIPYINRDLIDIYQLMKIAFYAGYNNYSVVMNIPSIEFYTTQKLNRLGTYVAPDKISRSKISDKLIHRIGKMKLKIK